VKAREGFACDDAGCVARLDGGGLVAIGTSPAALADDCARATLVITTRRAPPACAATVIDRTASRQGGALALRRDGGAWEVTAARPPGEARPWAAGGAGGTTGVSVPKSGAPGPRDATPRAEDLGIDD
jgi:competence protein ComEC